MATTLNRAHTFANGEVEINYLMNRKKEKNLQDDTDKSALTRLMEV